jgi:hypothetical protein
MPSRPPTKPPQPDGVSSVVTLVIVFGLIAGVWSLFQPDILGACFGVVALILLAHQYRT